MSVAFSVTSATLVAAITVLIVLAGMVERGVEILKVPVEKILKDEAWRRASKITLAILLGFGLSALLRLDVISALGIQGVPFVAGYAVTGVMASFGASFWHPILEWLKTIPTR